MAKIIRIGTRGSQLALWQANWVKSEIERIFHTMNDTCKELFEISKNTTQFLPVIEIVKIKTTGDQITDRPLSMVGGKGLFVKEIEQQLLDKEIDIAVHSMKDMPAELPEGLIVGAIPARENPFDVLISRNNIPLNGLPSGARIGTSSLRRASQIKHARPDIIPVSIRGNLDTRLKKLDTGEYDAIILAAAGLIRLGMAERITQYLDASIMVPAVGQGALCIESRQSQFLQKDIAFFQNHLPSNLSSNQYDLLISQILGKLDDIETRISVEAERAFLKKMEGSCHIPVACFGKLENREQYSDSPLLILTGLVASEDGVKIIKETLSRPLEILNHPLEILNHPLEILNHPLEISESLKDSQKIGIELADLLLTKGAKKILENLKN